MAKKPTIRVAVVESDPLRFIGFRSLFETEPDLELVSHTLAELGTRPELDLVLLGSRNGHNLFDLMAGMKAARPDLRIIVTGSGADDETILKAVAAGAKGYVDEAATAEEFIQAIRMVNAGSVWAPRRVLSIFIERVTSSPGRIFPAGPGAVSAGAGQAHPTGATGRLSVVRQSPGWSWRLSVQGGLGCGRLA